MGKKFYLLLGLGIGYVLGSRAGRKRYEQIKRAAGTVWNDPRVQSGVQHVEDFAKDKGADLTSALADGAKKVVNSVGSSIFDQDKRTVAPAKAPATKTSATKPSTAKATTAKASTAKKPAARKPATGTRAKPSTGTADTE